MPAQAITSAVNRSIEQAKLNLLEEGDANRRLCRRLTHASSSPMPSTRSAARAMRGSVDQRRALTWHGGSQHDTTAEVSASSRGPARHTDAMSTSILRDQQRSRSTSIHVPVTNTDGEKTSTSGRSIGKVDAAAYRSRASALPPAPPHPAPPTCPQDCRWNLWKPQARSGCQRQSCGSLLVRGGGVDAALPTRRAVAEGLRRSPLLLAHPVHTTKAVLKLRKHEPYQYDSRRPGPNESGERFAGRCAKAFGAFGAPGCKG